jgi:hypothetical protein
MTTSLEKVFFNYILKNKKYFDIVMPYFFRNSEIQLVYGVLRVYILNNFEVSVPSPRQIWDMVNLEDREGLVTKDILKSILTVNLDEYDDKNFIEPKFNAWILTNRLKTGAVDIVDETRNLDNISDFDQAMASASKIQSIIEEASSTKFLTDDDLGSDFDDPDSHVQDTSRFKIKSGFETIDHMLGGGWDQGSLNIFMAETSNGKCCLSESLIYIKQNGIIKKVKIGALFTKISQGDNNI